MEPNKLTDEEKKQQRAEYLKKYREENKDKLKQYYIKNKQVLSEKKKEYRQKNKQAIKEYMTEYRKEKKDLIKLSKKKYHDEKIKSDPLYKLSCNIRTLIRASLNGKGHKKNTKTENILGCSFDEFKQYLESKFEPWMNWNNYGNWNGIPNEPNTAWDIDHITPNSFGLTENEVIKLNHYTNLQPLCAFTNRKIKRNNP